MGDMGDTPMVNLMLRHPGGVKTAPARQSAYESDNPRTGFMDEMRSYGFTLVNAGLKMHRYAGVKMHQ